MNIRYSSLIALATISGALLIYTACSNSDAVTETNPDAGGASSSGQGASSGGGPIQPLPDAGTLPDGAPADCYTLSPDASPSNFEIINACTDADKVTRNPQLAKLYPDGGLPPLQ